MNKITGVLPVTNAPSNESHRRENSPAIDKGAGARVSPAVDSVVLTGTAKKLQQVEGLMAGAADIDEQKVAQVRAAIENGSYSVDAGRVTDKLLAMDEALKK